MSHIVSPAWLYEHRNDEHFVVADCRFALGKPDSGQTAYEQDHIPGAVYFDLERDLSAPVGKHGGRHPLPDVQELAAKLGQAGIGPGVRVVAYDDQGGAMASRLWWLLQYLGHEQVYLLDGGYSAWKAAGYAVTDERAEARAAVFTPDVQSDWVVHIDELKSRLGNGGTVVVDSRERNRYLGLEEPIDPVAGHVPGAINRFWKDGLNGKGRWRDASEQAVRFVDLKDAEEVIVYCGSGVTACPNVIALREAGVKNVKLYAGSWSDWVSYPDNPVATGEE